jgi:hypothetical protein
LEAGALVEGDGEHEPFEAALVAKSEIEADFFGEGLAFGAFDLDASAEHLLADADAGGAGGLARTAVEAVVHVAEEVVGGRKEAFFNLAHELDAAARGLDFEEIGGVGGADGEAGSTADAGEEVVVIGRVEGGLVEGVGRGQVAEGDCGLL